MIACVAGVPDCKSISFTPTIPGNYSYTVTATNSDGCSATRMVTFCVVNIQVPGQANRVYVYRVPAGNPAHASTITVNTNALAALLAQNPVSQLGSQGQVCGSPMVRMVQNPGSGNVPGAGMRIYPNPNHGVFSIDLPATDGLRFVSVSDVAGKVILRKELARIEAGNTIHLDIGDAANGIYFIDVLCGGQRFRAKLLVN